MKIPAKYVGAMTLVIEYVSHLAEAFVADGLLPIHVGLFRLSLMFWAGHIAAKYTVKSLGHSWHEGAIKAQIAAVKTESARAEALLAQLHKQMGENENVVPAAKPAGPYL